MNCFFKESPYYRTNLSTIELQSYKIVIFSALFFYNNYAIAINRYMPTRKLNNLEDLGSFVFSTDADFEYESEEPTETLPPSGQYLEAYFTRKGRSGKTVTIIKGFKETTEMLKSLSKTLKMECGVGGTVKEESIIIQGNHLDKVMKILINKGYNIKRTGG